jgi:hypothetical protein
MVLFKEFGDISIPLFINVKLVKKAQWLSWLERRPVTAEVEGSSPFWVVVKY